MVAPFSAEEIIRLRDDTPGCAEILHLNNAGASLPPRPVLEAVIGHLEREARIGGYEAAEEAAARVDAVYGSLARLLNVAGPDEIALMENSTRAFDMAFYALPFKAGDVVLTSRAEYHSNFVVYLHIAKRGVAVEVIPADASHQLDIEALKSRLVRARRAGEPIRAISVVHVPTHTGLVQPVEQVGALAREHGIFFIVDATQSVGQLPVDVRAIGCHALAGTSRKFLRGPRGIGFLWVEREWLERLEPPFMEGHAAEWVEPDRYVIRPDAKRYEVWESYVAGRLGLGAAVDYALALGLDRIWERIRFLGERLRARLRAIPGVAVHDIGQVQGGIVSFTLRGRTGQEIKEALRRRRINVAISGERASLLDMRARGLRETLRASVHYYNTEAELDRFADELARLVT
ncbi:MAG TPA: aminotransferase class V-fold PLP-dependent enzyme [Methylomirabilota bacterium]|nr:aminotransferase class V-fold PLP-dependent enzyme [Methylomirabilota bacterium]